MTLPQYLYKYRAVSNDQDREWLEQILREGSFYARCPEQLDDPFDFSPLLERTTNEDAFRCWLSEDLQASGRMLPGETLAEAVEREFTYHYPPSRSYVELVEGRFRSRLNSAGVICFSANCDSLLMWSLYADSHMGVCVELATQKIACESHRAANSPEFRPVTYQRERPRVRLFGRVRELHQRSSLTKPLEWEYQQEWRLVLESTLDSGKLPQTVSLGKESISSLTLGARMNVSERARLVKLVKAIAPQAAVYQAQKSEELFAMGARALIYAPQEAPHAVLPS